MTYTTQPTSRKALFSSRIVTIILASCALFVLQASPAQAQWTTPNGANNINNTNSGNVGIGTTTPNYKLDVLGNINTAAGLCIAGICKASWSDVGFWSSAIGGHIFYGMGNVGVGTTSPEAGVHVATESTANSRGLIIQQSNTGNNSAFLILRKSRGTIGAPSTIVNGDSLGAIYSEAHTGSAYLRTGASMKFVSNGTVAAGSVPTDIAFSTGSSGTGTEYMRITSGGHVGIGTINPVFDTNGGRYFSVDAGSGFMGSIGVAGGTNSAGITVGQMAFVNSNLGGTEKRIATIVGATEAASNSGTLDFYTMSAGTWGIPKLRISSGGNVGVGTMSPGFRLDVQGGQLNASGGLCIGGDCKTAWSQVGGTSQWTTGGSGAIYYNAGNVGLGTTTPTAKLHILSADDTVAPALSVRQDNSPTFGFDVTLDNNVNGNLTVRRVNSGVAANVMTFDRSGGTVGIGTTAPVNLLQVGSSSSTAHQYITVDAGAGFQSAIDFRSAGVQRWAIYRPASGTDLRFFDGGGDRLVLQNGGNVGIGTATPLTKLHVSGGTRVDGTNGRLYLGTGAATNFRGLEIIEENATTFSIRHHDPGVAWQNIALNPYGGTVGIGTPTPNTGYKLDVNGNTNITGNINVTGTINAKYQDMAEWVESSQALPAGTVVVLDHTKSNQVVASSQSYDTRVAGVISAQPGIMLGEKGDGKVLVATTGRVKVRVDATAGAIQVGDLLVTSDVAGVAKKSESINLGGVQFHRPGTLIGKALEPLEKGVGEILVLLSLQ